MAELETGLQLLQLPSTALVAILDCLGNAAEVVCAASACKALWTISAQCTRVTSITFGCFHPELLRSIPSIVNRFPCIQQLNLAHCSALPEQCMLPMQAWPLRVLDVTNMWHYNGVGSNSCMAAWGPTLTQLTADGTALAVAGDGEGASLTEHSGGLMDGAQQQQQQQQHNPDAFAAAAAAAAQGQQQHGGSGNGGRHWVMQTGQLQQLHLRSLLTGNPIRCRTHGSSSGCSCEEETLLSKLLLQNPFLMHLDLSGNTGLPDRLLYGALTGTSALLQTLNLSGCELLKPGYVGTCCPGLKDLNVAGTAAGDPDVAMLAAGLSCLTRLVLNGCKKVSDVGLAALAAAPALLSGHLQHLDSGSLTRGTPAAVTRLAAAWAKASSSSSSSGGRRQLHVGFSHTAGVTDACLAALIGPAAAATSCAAAGSSRAASTAASPAGPAAKAAAVLTQHMQSKLRLDDNLCEGTQQLNSARTAAATAGASSQQPQNAGLVSLCGLQLAGCNAVSGLALQRLAAAGLLCDLQQLDLSGMQALRQSKAPWDVAANVAAVTGTVAGATGAPQQQQQQQQVVRIEPRAGLGAAPPATVLQRVFKFCGGQLKSLVLDGCHIDDATAAFIGGRCQQLQHLSLVGCKGLSSSGLHALLSNAARGTVSLAAASVAAGRNLSTSSSGSCSLRSLQLGGSGCRWSEAEALAGLTSLTELRVLRRSSAKDAELAPILTANRGLRRLVLIGCYSLTDALFTMAADSQAAGGVGRGDSKEPPTSSSSSNSSATWLATTPITNTHCNETGAYRSSWLTGSAPHASAGLGLQQHLTALTLTASDGMRGSSIPLLRGLRHLRLSFCSCIAAESVQQVVLSCRKLALLELPLELRYLLVEPSPKVYYANVRGFGSGSGFATTHHAASQRASSKSKGGGGRGGGGRGETVGTAQRGRLLGVAGVATGVEWPGLVPLQGPGGHIHGLKLVLT